MHSVRLIASETNFGANFVCLLLASLFPRLRVALKTNRNIPAIHSHSLSHHRMIPEKYKPKFRPFKELIAVPELTWEFGQQLIAEFFASMIFIFILVGNSLTLVWAGQGANFGLNNGTNKIAAFLTSMGLTYAFGELGGAHFNPVLTAGLMVSLRMNWIVGIMYLIIQFVASFAAVGLLLALFPVSPTGSLGNARAVNLRVPPPITDAGYWFYQLLVSIFLVFVYFFFVYDRRPGAFREDMSKKERSELKEERRRYLTRQSLIPLFVGALYGCTTAYNHPWRQLSVCLIAQQCGKAWIWNVSGFLGAIAAAVLYMFWWQLTQKPTKAAINPAVPVMELVDEE